ncbi:hypothetical protein BDL97_19G071100 [Sphagnum fallax]|nr:hypothetical protein BDL97_19G071100 [Sphagnum fallax]
MMKKAILMLSIIMSLVLLLLLLQSSSSSSSLAAERTMVGAPKNIPNSNSVEIRELANFAVSQYNSGKNVVHKLSFSKVVSAREQVVAGTMYYLRIVVLESSTPKLYDCKIWVKPWENFKQLESFVPVVSPQCTLTDNPDTTATAADCASKEEQKIQG